MNNKKRTMRRVTVRRRTRAYIYAAVGLVLFILMFGFVGGMDLNTIPTGKGTLGALACVVSSGFCWRRAGWLYDC